jgi:hypothetical protein
MTTFNPFRVSFDEPLASEAHRRAWVGAIAVCGVALVVGGASFVALMNASSGTIAAWSNARLLEDEMAAIPCSEQKWPYIQARCQTRPDAKPVARTSAKPDVAAPASQPSTTGAAPSPELLEPAAPIQAAPDQAASPQHARREQPKREARKVRQQRIEARNGTRKLARDERSARRGDEFPFGGNQQVVIQRGAFDGGLFGIFR